MFGVSGWVKVYSYTRLRRSITEYQPWYLTSDEGLAEPRVVVLALESSRVHNGGVIAKFTGVYDRAAAGRLVGREITIAEEQLAPLPESEYYWFQLVGLKVVNAEGQELGVVSHMLETGANDVLVVEGANGSHLIPYVPGDYVKTVDLEKMRIEVVWDAGWRE